MPTLPLYSIPVTGGASHGVRAPGGYEWWYFDAQDSTSHRFVAVTISDGWIFSSEYLRRYARYRRRPTRVAPPTPREFPSIEFVLYEGGARRASFLTTPPVGSLHASSDRFAIECCNCSVQARGDGSIELRLAGLSLLKTRQDRVAAELCFKPILPDEVGELPIVNPGQSRDVHCWIPAHPHCSVSGTISIAGEPLKFAGLGYQDANYGTAPLGLAAESWLRGRVLLEDRALAFTITGMRDGTERVVRLVDLSASGARVKEFAAGAVDWCTVAKDGDRYPREMKLGPGLSLCEPRLLDSSASQLRISYRARVGGGDSIALCELIRPPGA